MNIEGDINWPDVAKTGLQTLDNTFFFNLRKKMLLSKDELHLMIWIKKYSFIFSFIIFSDNSSAEKH